ncbi:hypothetical protein [Polynucleobacter asymbioticus]|jgi:hypothetical protein|uniref:Uncharacterized protein n=1 Tax=Polynucleobacter asymbioticus TaxID=576611 RepID=A0AAC9NGZ6_9BURK|nr:hypothetical protein [Polynucleobacter asymbioticus]APB98160.1 hypothetical protein A4F89_01825 [Polynucleobacter asymbioticus]APC00446.1 hypothetical protein AOC25_01830 [Polynucleobacter asymbioticus]
MASRFSTFKHAIKHSIRINLIRAIHFLSAKPYLYKKPIGVLKKHFPGLYKFIPLLLARLKISPTVNKAIRVRGDQEHVLSPLGEKILMDLESVVPVMNRDE